MHGEAKHKDGQDGQKPGQVLQQIPDDDGPGSEQMMEGQKVQDLHAGQQEGQREALIPTVDQRRPILLGHEDKGRHMDAHSGHSEQQYEHLNGSQSRLVRGIRQLEEKQAAQPDQQPDLVPIGHQTQSQDWIDGRYAHDAQVDHEVNVRGEVRHELDDGHLVELVAHGEREANPHGRAHNKGHQQEEDLPGSPGQGAVPEFLRVGENDE